MAKVSNASTTTELSPFVVISRQDWAELGRSTQQPLTAEEIKQIQGLGDVLDMQEVADVYLPLSQLLSLYVAETQSLHDSEANFLGERAKRVPFIIGVAGSVAVGKSTVARLLRELLSRWEGTPKVALVTTDGFLYPNAELEHRDLMSRKGFPESYDRKALLKFVSDIKSGEPKVQAPVYSHLAYDIVPNEFISIDQPDVLIIEGLNVLQTPEKDQPLALSDFFDFKIFVDADADDIKHWYLERFKKLRAGAFTNPKSFFHRYAELEFEDALATAEGFWENINLPNLIENIAPTLSRATLVLQKDKDHAVEQVLLRKS
ncbi:MAG: type I pantothenate kinase [Actinobacteria bacterium]|uniref:Pantothenate kinase n=1 Tax=freshwater metagenome TaxID=449393 RepID=A0A6J6GPV5_9ZZZZ|nr:type I pantothenate kinase [Actinomycetota bacterium]MTA30177.1 type I pantothenate kinase [Actinomycetota bacterium]